MNNIIGLTIAATTIFSTQAMACEQTTKIADKPNYAAHACSTASDYTYVRDYPTFRPIAELNRGECMEIVSSQVSSESANIEIYIGGTGVGAAQVAVYKGSEYYLVRGVSGNLRVLSVQHSRLR